MMSSFFFFQPAFMLSGFAFPIRNMPEAVQWLTYLNPMRYFMEIVRGVFLKGSGADVLWPQMVALARLRRSGAGFERAALPQAAGLINARRRSESPSSFPNRRLCGLRGAP